MIFISSQIPLEQLPNTREEIISKQDWFLFTDDIKTKNHEKDYELYKKYNQMFLYRLFYKEKLYNYLMTDKHYYKSFLYKHVLQNVKSITHAKKVKRFSEIVDFNKEIIQEKDYIFADEDIENMFSVFRENNFKENPICEVILGR